MIRFDRHFIALPLANLLQKNVAFEGDENRKLHFETIYFMLMAASVLRYPDHEQLFVEQTDANVYSVWAVLMQYHGIKLHPIAYFRQIIDYNPKELFKYGT